MSLPDFVDAAIQSAQNYNCWINKYNQEHPNTPKGYSEDNVLDVRKSPVLDCLELTVKRKKLDLAQVMIKADGIIYETGQIEPVYFDEDNCSLRVKLHNIEPEILFTAFKSRDIFVVSDLTFLIRKTEDWYRIYGHLLSIPALSIEGLSSVEFPISLSEEQASAVNLAMSEAMSYIWGAPGTGKTRAVLASCLYQFIANKRHVLLVAPTNNALDQSLIAVLDVLTAAGVPTSSVIRLGSPTTRLVEKYPEICPSEEDRRAAEKESRRNILKSVISSKVKIANNQELQHNLGILFDELQAKLADEKRMEFLKRELRQQKTLLIKCESRISDKRAYCDQYSYQLHKLSASFLHFLYRKRIQKLKDILNVSNKALSASYSERDTYKETIHSLEEELRSIDTDGLEDCKKRLMALIRPVKYLFPLIVDETTLTSSFTHEKAFSAISKRIFELQEKIPEALRNTDVADLKEELSTIEEELNNKPNNGNPDKDKVRYLCAATVDTCISTLTPDTFSFDHIFMDEAGYCSLAKGAVILGYGAPLTFFGDHMQLPPVCEVNEKTLWNNRSDKLKYVSYWTQSALHIEECFTTSPDDISSRYFSGSDPDFKMLKKTALSKSYRFGTALASILASEVYTPEFAGNENVETEIYFVDSEATHNSESGRKSFTEVHNTVRIAEKLTSMGADFSILVPYRAQLSVLNKVLKADERILTIHASQGREWDTVILNVVDNSQNPPWFMDSTNRKSRGKQIINTAISRARKRLIIVCEADFWYSRRSNQLIGKLVDSATPLKP